MEFAFIHAIQRIAGEEVITMSDCDHIIAICTQKDGRKLAMRQSRYETGGFSEVFQDEMLDFCAEWECRTEINWGDIHRKMNI